MNKTLTAPILPDKCFANCDAHHPGLNTGTTLNFFLDDRINRAEVLFPGVGAFLIAAIIGSWLHASNVADIDRKLGIQRSGGIIDK